MKELVEFIKNKCSQEEIQKLIKELSVKDETKENNVPRTWEEYCSTITKGYYIDTHSNINNAAYNQGAADFDKAKNVLPTEELAEAFLAMMQLMSLRQAWIKDWEPDWENENECKYCITIVENFLKISTYWSACRSLSFPTEEMAQDFLHCFKDLIKKAKVLI